MKPTRIAILIASVLCLAGAAIAQTVVDTKVKSGLVIGKTSHSVVLKMDDGVVREIEVPPGRTAMVDGKEVGLADLKLGTTLSATIHTIAKPVEVKTVTIKDGEVVKASGAILTTREKDGFHTYLVPAGFKFLVDGKETGIESLTTGMKINATIVTTSKEMTTETRRAGVAGKAPAEPAPVPVAAQAAAPPAPLPTEAAAAAKPAPAKAEAPAPAPAPETAAPAPATTEAVAPATPTLAPAPEPAPASSRTTTIVIGLIVLVVLVVLIYLGTRKKN